MTSDPSSYERPFQPDPAAGKTPGGRGQGRDDQASGVSRPSEPAPTANGAARRRTTRAGMIWAAVVAALVVFVLLVVFFIQNQDLVLVSFLGLEGPVPLGLALFIAAVAGGVLVAVVGAVRIIQLRAAAHRLRHTPPTAG